MPLIPHDRLQAFATDILAAAGMEADKAQTTASVLLEGDMIGHDTHGVSLIPMYLKALSSGEMSGSGAPEVVSDRGACFVWDGRLLPGAWLVTRALERACDRVTTHGVVTAAIRSSHHTCALAAFMRPVTERGFIARLSCSNPAANRMAPYGGTRPLLTPNPIAYGFPTRGTPIVVDVSCSITTTTMTQTLARSGGRFPEPWAQTADGTPTDDPREVTEHGGSLLPLGGALKGHKGYGLALSEELLTQGLSGKGRANTDAPGPLAQSVFLQVMDPEAFAGLDPFLDQSDHLAEACRSNPPAAGATGAVRVPGDSAAAKRARALAEGVPVAASVLEALNEAAMRLDAGALEVA